MSFVDEVMFWVTVTRTVSSHGNVIRNRENFNDFLLLTY